MSIAYYIYYRVASGESGRAERIVGSLLEDVRKRTGVAGRLLHRRDDPATWMEVYEGIADESAFAASLADAVERSGFPRVLAEGSTRVTEIFTPV